MIKSKVYLSGLFLIFSFSTVSNIHSQIRNDFILPDVLGYKVIKCDFHLHTIYSDGEVWPPLRVDEAWRQGLDLITLTDHIDENYIDNIMPENRNIPYKLAEPFAEKFGITLVKGSEISKADPPGHLNALFLTDVEPINTKYYLDAVKAAVDQGAFVFWNHPGWKQPGFKSVWYLEQDTLYKNGWLKGIEVINGIYYDPIAHQWCIDKGLTMMADTDAHLPTAYEFNLDRGEHRTMTLVLVKDNSIDAVKDALFNRRTILYYQNILVGDEKYLKPLFENSILIKNPNVTFKGRSTEYIFITNNSSMDYELESIADSDLLRFPTKLKLFAGTTTALELRPKARGITGKKQTTLFYKVKNLMILPEQFMTYEMKIECDFQSK